MSPRSLVRTQAREEFFSANKKMEYSPGTEATIIKECFARGSVRVVPEAIVIPKRYRDKI